MTAGEIVAIIAALGALATGIISAIVAGLTARSAARKDELIVLREAITTLQAENTRLLARIQSLEDDVIEREKRIAVLELSLREQTQARADREQRIRELESEVSTLTAKVAILENGSRKKG